MDQTNGVEAALRHWKSAQDLSSAVQWLKASQRAGLITEQDLNLAAFLGFKPAENLTGLTRATKDISEWLKGLENWPPVISTRASLALAEAVNEQIQFSPEPEIRSRKHLASNVIESVKNWLKQSDQTQKNQVATYRDELGWPVRRAEFKVILWLAMSVDPLTDNSATECCVRIIAYCIAGKILSESDAKELIQLALLSWLLKIESDLVKTAL